MTRVRRGLAPVLFGWATLGCGGLLAAVIAHWLVDVAGDYVLRRDSYDHIAHDSRLIAFSIAAAFALLCSALVIRAAVRDVRRFRGALTAVLGSGAAVGWIRLAARLVPLTALLLASMESVDSALDLGRLPSLSDAFGGSLVLGGAIALASAAAVSLVIGEFLRRLYASRRSIAAAIERFLIPGQRVSADRGCRTLAAASPFLQARSSALARRLGLRAPPLPA